MCTLYGVHNVTDEEFPIIEHILIEKFLIRSLIYIFIDLRHLRRRSISYDDKHILVILLTKIRINISRIYNIFF